MILKVEYDQLVKTNKFARLGARTFKTSVIACLLISRPFQHSPLYNQLSLQVADDCAVPWTPCHV